MNAFISQEQEHWDHEAGAASEFQNCVTEASQDLSSQNSKSAQQIAEALKAGRFVVVVEAPAYCRATDAIVGTHVCFVQSFAERLPAEISASLRAGQDREEYYYVLPRAVLPKAPVEVDDCPF